MAQLCIDSLGVIGDTPSESLRDRLSRDFREQHPEVPWDDMAGMRDIITHHYDRLDLDIVWQVIQRNIPELLAMITPLLPVEES